MTKDQWRKRQEQWRRFNAWETEHIADSLSPAERLAEIGALVDLALANRRAEVESVQELRVAAIAIARMRQCLAVLRRAA